MEEGNDNEEKFVKMVHYVLQCDICDDFKILAFLIGLHQLIIFFCLWDSRMDHKHYKKVTWPPRRGLHPENYVNVIRQLFVEPGERVAASNSHEAGFGQTVCKKFIL